MTNKKLNKLRSLDSTLIANVARQSQNASDFELLDWKVTTLSKKGIANPEGLFLFSGTGLMDGQVTPWSAVLKILQEPKEDTVLNMWNWKREFLAHQSGLLSSLPGPVVVPHCYGLSEHDKEAWIWIEHVRGKTGVDWMQEDYVLAAYELGQFNGNCLMQRINPEFSWLCRDHARNWFPTRTEITRAFENEIVKQAFSQDMRQRCLQQWADREKFFTTLDALPQVLSHYDFNCRNLIRRDRANRKPEIVALDWAWVGYGALGGDLYSLLGSSAVLTELAVSDLLALEELAIQAYLNGLSKTGWAGDPDTVRLAYVTWTSLWVGTPMLELAAFWSSDEALSWFEEAYDCSIAEYVAGTVSLCEFGLERADEARFLIHQLGFDEKSE